MLVHRLRRWPNIVPTLGERVVFAGLQDTTHQTLHAVPMLGYRWASAADGGPALDQLLVRRHISGETQRHLVCICSSLHKLQTEPPGDCFVHFRCTGTMGNIRAPKVSQVPRF